MLGSGGMGEVWKAWDPDLRRWAALKFLTKQLPEEHARFRSEAQMAAKLAHPNIAAIYEVGEHEGRPFIAMQFVEGRTLDGWPASDRRGLAKLMRDAARALALAHDQGVVHRDIKPENLMVDASGRVVVTDFGLARPIEGGASAVSMPGTALGTPSYMSPEQSRGAPVDGRADIYGLGATLYAVCGRRLPFAGANASSRSSVRPDHRSTYARSSSMRRHSSRDSGVSCGDRLRPCRIAS